MIAVYVMPLVDSDRKVEISVHGRHVADGILG